jgi:hypothetical protein
VSADIPDATSLGSASSTLLVRSESVPQTTLEGAKVEDPLALVGESLRRDARPARLPRLACWGFSEEALGGAH